MGVRQAMVNRLVMWLGIAAAGFAACGPATAQIVGEHLAMRAEPDFAPGIVQQRRGTFMSESVPKGERLDMWSRMVTIQRFPWRPGLTPDQMADSLGRGFEGACAGTTLTPVRSLDVDGHKAAYLRADCPLNPQTGKPETMFARILIGDEMVHLVQIAFRHRPTSAEAAWAERTIAATRLCARTSADVGCR